MECINSWSCNNTCTLIWMWKQNCNSVFKSALIFSFQCTIYEKQNYFKCTCTQQYIMYIYSSTHHWVVMVSASSFSPISLRAVCSTLQDGTPTWLTLSCCCSQAASISLMQSLMSPRCSLSILCNVECSSPRARPRSFQLTTFFNFVYTLNWSSIPV